MKRNREKTATRHTQQQMPPVGYTYLVKNPTSNEVNVCAWDSALYPGTSVVIPTRYGLDLGVVIASADTLHLSYEPGDTQVQGACHNKRSVNEYEDDTIEILYQSEAEAHPCESCYGCSPGGEPQEIDLPPNILWIDRLATPSDLSRSQEMRSKEPEAMRICKEKIAYHKLDMKLVAAHYLLGEPKIIFFFTADVRVDFRELVKDLVSVFRIRIELRQIGVRDESRVLGGLAVCGRDYCCNSVTDKLNPVSIKMAKEQNLSLNSMKISGPCGRLLCCLSYEYDFYVEEKRQYPPEGSRLKIGHDLMRITEVNILSRQITVSGSEGRMISLPQDAVYYNSEASRWEVEKGWVEEFLST